jgi:protein-S-isoprenylcysteine O-methyltransferase Ste14
MSGDGDSGPQPRTSPLSANGPIAERDAVAETASSGALGVGPRLAELAILLVAIVGAVALGLGISDYLAEHPDVLGYLLAYAGFRISDALLRTDPETGVAREAPAARWQSEAPILILFAAAPFERTYLYGGEAPGAIAAFGLFMELAGLWFVIGARIQLRFGATGQDQSFARSGFYRYIRHPIYGGGCLVLLGWPFVFGAPIVAIATMAILYLAARLRIAKEEAEMIARFGEDYESYMRETDRLIPSVW